VLATHFEGDEGSVRLVDFFAMRRGGREHPARELVRIVEAMRGRARVRVRFSPRLDYGDVEPWIYRWAEAAHVAVGSNTALLLSGDIAMVLDGPHDLVPSSSCARASARTWRCSTCLPSASTRSRRLRASARRSTRTSKRRWRGGATGPQADRPERSARPLGSALGHHAQGAHLRADRGIIAAPTTSLPEAPGGERNWDYRYSWIRDSVFTVRALAAWAVAPRPMASAASSSAARRQCRRSAGRVRRGRQAPAHRGGARHLEGWRGSRPVRIGNAAHEQFQGDLYGLLLELAGAGASGATCRRPPTGTSSSPSWSAPFGAGPRRPRHLGGPRPAAALRALEGHVLGAR
jgi:GH15 family glucan-1,4-alpha-glucosidase